MNSISFREREYSDTSGNNGAAMPPIMGQQIMGQQKVGKVKWFNPKKGYGFIEIPGMSDVFVHYKVIVTRGNRVLRSGQKVYVNVVDGKRGPAANSVKLS